MEWKMAYIEIQNITHRYADAAKALDNVKLSIEQGSFFSLLGPSGCGKTTLLNIIGGFLTPSEGSIIIDGNDVTDLPPNKRNIGMVFQNYALFPHLSVFENIAYGLRVQKQPKKEIERRVEECLALVRLEGFAERMPHQLSGGQQQRTAIARALANEPSILMLDEPLGNLDAKLRKDMQVELRRIQRSTGITTIMVTHDQDEAMTMSDGIGIMENGILQQVGSPFEIYEKPSNSFVAGFIGKVNMCETEPGSGTRVNSLDWFRSDGTPLWFDTAKGTGKGPIACIRPEKIKLTFEEHDGSVSARLRDVIYAGSILQAYAELEGGGTLELEMVTSGLRSLPKEGDGVHLSWPDDAVILVERSEGARNEAD